MQQNTGSKPVGVMCKQVTWVLNFMISKFEVISTLVTTPLPSSQLNATITWYDQRMGAPILQGFLINIIIIIIINLH